MDEFNLKYKKISDLYLSDYEPLATSSYGLKRQHNYTAQKSILSNSNTLMDTNAIETLMSYNQDMKASGVYSPLSNSIKFHNHSTKTQSTLNTASMNDKINNVSTRKANLSMLNYVAFLEKTSLLSSENDSQQLSNPLKSALNNKWSKKMFLNNKWVGSGFNNDEITKASPVSNFSNKLINEEISPRFKDLKSAGTSFLPSERNSRLVNNINFTKTNLNYADNDNNLTAMINASNNTLPSNMQESLFTSSNTQ